MSIARDFNKDDDLYFWEGHDGNPLFMIFIYRDHSSLANTHSNTEQLRFTGELRRNTFDTGQKHGFQTPWTAYSQ